MSRVALRAGTPATHTSVQTLLVAWQNPSSRTYVLLGAALDYGDHYDFRYFPGVEKNPDFRPIPGFGDVRKTYSSKVLFPFFSTRIMSKGRADRGEWLQRLQLTEDAAPFEILANSFGDRLADRYQLFAEPTIDLVNRTLDFCVPVHGYRYIKDEAKEFVDSVLRAGDELEIKPEPNNPRDPRAQAVFAGKHKVGFVPAPVLDYLDRHGKHGKFSASVRRINPSSDGSQLRVVMALRWRESDEEAQMRYQ